MAASSERPLPHAEAIDVSPSGALLALAEPVGLPLGQRVVVSLGFDDGRVHAFGFVRRLARGDDFRTYVAVEFDPLSDEEWERLVDRLDALERGAEREVEDAAVPARHPADASA